MQTHGADGIGDDGTCVITVLRIIFAIRILEQLDSAVTLQECVLEDVAVEDMAVMAALSGNLEAVKGPVVHSKTALVNN